MGEENLGSVQLVAREGFLVGLDETHLAHRGGGPELVHLVGRRRQPSRCIPAAMAPDDTSVTSRPSARRAATWRAQSSIAALSRPAPLLVTSALPTFTTSRRALRSLSLMMLVRRR